MGDGGARRFGRGRRLAGVLAMAVLLASCGGGGGGSADDSPLGQARAMLRERATLLAEGDVDGYMAAVAPGAEEQERAIAEGAAAVPLAYVNATVAAGGPRTETRIGNAMVQIVYRYEGLPDDNRFEFDLSYDLERQNGKWVITKSLPGDEGLPMWASGPVATSQSEHFLGLRRPSLAAPDADAALAAAEDARRALADRLEVLESDPVHLVLMASSEEEYEEISGMPTSRGELAVTGFFFLSLSRPESRHMLVKAHRLVEAGDATSDDGQTLPAKVVFQHELAHLALTRFDGPVTPGWVNEGAAMYLAGERRRENWKRGLDEGLFDSVSIDAIANDKSLSNGVEYAYVNAAALYLIDTFGAPQFFDFYRRFLPLAPTESFMSDPTGVVLLETFDLSVTELDRRTRTYMEAAVAAAG